MAMLFIMVSNLHPRARIAAPQKALAPLCTIGPVSLGGLACGRLSPCHARRASGGPVGHPQRAAQDQSPAKPSPGRGRFHPARPVSDPSTLPRRLPRARRGC